MKVNQITTEDVQSMRDWNLLNGQAYKCPRGGYLSASWGPN